MSRMLKGLSFAVSWIFYAAGALLFFQGRVLFLFLPKEWAIHDNFWSGLLVSFTVAPLLIVIGLPFRAWSGRDIV